MGVLIVLGALAVLPVHPAAAVPLNRPDDPVVLTGASATPLVGSSPRRVVAFRWLSGSWEQVPVQVDERAWIDFGRVPATNGSAGARGTVYGTAPIGVEALQYADVGTFVGPDPDPEVDADDEIAFMAHDAGDRADGATPPDHTVPGSGVEVALTDRLVPGAAGWVYLFAHDGTLDPSAGQQYVDYQFSLASGSYKSTYRRADGPNAENSTITTARYRHHFADRWVDDQLAITDGTATGVDILDRHRNQFAPGECGRSEDTFVDGEGAFVANRVGPVRAIRAYVGANSGPLTQRTHVFYEGRHDIVTDLRVHLIPGIMDLLDFSPAAAGMTYRNDRMASGVTIDGLPDVVPFDGARWELVRGAQGSLISTRSVTVGDMAPPDVDTFYLDDSTPPYDQCTGDAFAFGASGLQVSQLIPNTDPRFVPLARFRGRRVMVYRPPGATAADAGAVADRVATPLTVRTRRFSAYPPHGFSDVPGLAWYGPALDWAAAEGVVNGFLDGTFRPNTNVNRGQGVNSTWHSVGDPPSSGPHGFPDVPPGAFYEDALAWAVEQGVIQGFPDGTFRARDPVTRGQVVNMLWHAVGAPDESPPPHGFTDVRSDAFYRAALDWAKARGVVVGYPDGTYRPRDPVTRAQFVAMLFRTAQMS